MTTTPQVTITGIGVLGPGLAGWPQARALLRDPAAWRPAAVVLPLPARLPAAERRRSGAIVRLSLAVADEACAAAAADVRRIATIFASSAADTANCHALCETLATAERAVSPTRFTNSVHNAPAGYWHIATASRAPSTSVCAHDASFGAGLLEALTQCVAWQRAVLFVCADVPYPPPLHALRPLPDAFGVAFVLDPAPGAMGWARLTLRIGEGIDGDAAPPQGDGLAALAGATPAGRSLPLLAAIARGRAETITLADLRPFGLAVDVQPQIQPQA